MILKPRRQPVILTKPPRPQRPPRLQPMVIRKPCGFCNRVRRVFGLAPR